jgi:hypothetical protein
LYGNGARKICPSGVTIIALPGEVLIQISIAAPAAAASTAGVATPPSRASAARVPPSEAAALGLPPPPPIIIDTVTATAATTSDTPTTQIRMRVAPPRPRSRRGAVMRGREVERIGSSTSALMSARISSVVW